MKEFKYRHNNSLLTVRFYNLFYLDLFYLISEWSPLLYQARNSTSSDTPYAHKNSRPFSILDICTHVVYNIHSMSSNASVKLVFMLFSDVNYSQLLITYKYRLAVPVRNLVLIPFANLTETYRTLHWWPAWAMVTFRSASYFLSAKTVYQTCSVEDRSVRRMYQSWRSFVILRNSKRSTKHDSYQKRPAFSWSV